MQDACLVDFARSLTARPWTVGTTDIRRLTEVGLSATSIALVIGLVALFNYLTRVADGTGIEADYETELPRFVYRGVAESVPRPEAAEWPPVNSSIELLSLLPDVRAAWERWRDYLLQGPTLLPAATRQQLRGIAARNACDASVAPARTEAVNALSDFAEKLSRTPWLVASPDVEALRSTGLDDLAILHVIAVVGYQSAESRLRIGLTALARVEDEPASAG